MIAAFLIHVPRQNLKHKAVENSHAHDCPEIHVLLVPLEYMKHHLLPAWRTCLKDSRTKPISAYMKFVASDFTVEAYAAPWLWVQNCEMKLGSGLAHCCSRVFKAPQTAPTSSPEPSTLDRSASQSVGSSHRDWYQVSG